MKKAILVLAMLLVSGCVSSSTKATAYCDENWSGRYNSWQECYDRQLPMQNRGLKALGAGLKGMGDGFKSSGETYQSQPARTCITTGQPGLYTTNCN